MRKLKLQELNRISESEFKAAPKVPVKVWLDNIRSGHNVGAAFRTSDAFRIEEVLLSGITPKPPHREILKTALGADQSMEWNYVNDLKNYCESAKADGYKIYAVEQTDQPIWLQDVKPATTDKLILIFGNEVKGVSNELLELVDGSIEIPQHGTKHSFNVSVSIGIVLWQVCQNHQPTK